MSLGKSGIESIDVDDGILLIAKTEGAQETVDLDIWVVGPDANVVTVLALIPEPSVLSSM